MKLAIIGGGGFRTPLVFQALQTDPERLIDHIVLVDDDPQRLHVIQQVLSGMAERTAWSPQVTVTTSLRDGIAGTDFVFAAIRAGGLSGREHDENVPLRHGVLGQETVGIGGILYGLRSIPAMLAIAQTVAEVAPQSWFINFTNPAGMVTEALSQVLPGQVVGICDSPAALLRRVCRVLGIEDPSAYDYVGLNHLGWLRSVSKDGHDLLPSLLQDDPQLLSFEEGQLFGPTLLRALGSIPNEYLHYYYFANDVVASLIATTSRASFLAGQQNAFYAAAESAQNAAAVWRSAVNERNRTYMATSRDAAGIGERDPDDVEGGGYEQIALQTMRAIARDSGQRMILNVPNGRSIAELDADAVVEIPCTVGKYGPVAQPVAGLLPEQAGLMLQIKAVERYTIEAAKNADRDALWAAVAAHPLSGSFPVAERVVIEWMSHFPAIASKFGFS